MQFTTSPWSPLAARCKPVNPTLCWWLRSTSARFSSGYSLLPGGVVDDSRVSALSHGVDRHDVSAAVWVANGFTCRANIERLIGSLVELTLNVQFSEIERSIFSLMNWPVTLNIYNKYIHRQFSHEKIHLTPIIYYRVGILRT